MIRMKADRALVSRMRRALVGEKFFAAHPTWANRTTQDRSAGLPPAALSYSPAFSTPLGILIPKFQSAMLHTTVGGGEPMTFSAAKPGGFQFLVAVGKSPVESGADNPMEPDHATTAATRCSNFETRTMGTERSLCPATLPWHRSFNCDRNHGSELTTIRVCGIPILDGKQVHEIPETRCREKFPQAQAPAGRKQISFARKSPLMLSQISI